MDLVAVVREDDVDEVLADIVDVAFHGREHDDTAPAGFAPFHVRLEVSDGGLHRLGRLEDERKLHLARGEQVADGLHPREQGAVHDLEGAVRRERLVEVRLQPDPVTVDDALAEAAFDRPAAAVISGHRARLGAREGARERGEGVVSLAPSVVDEIETDLAVGGVDLVQRSDPAGVDDRGVEARGDALVEEHRVQHAAGRRCETEGDVRDAEHRVDTRELSFDGADRLDGLDAVPPAFFHAGRQGQGEGVEEEILGCESVTPDGEVADRAGRGELPRGGAGLPLLVDARADDRGAVFRRERQEGVEPRTRTVAVLEVHRVKEGPSADELEGRAHDRGLGRVDHDGSSRLRRDPAHHLAHVGDAVGARVVDTDVDEVRALAYLVACHGRRRVEVTGKHRLAEALRPVRVRAFADDEERELLVEGNEAEERSRARLVLDVAVDGLEPLAASHDGVEVRGRRAAAAADRRHPELGREAMEVFGELVGREVVVHLPLDDRGEPCIRQHRDRQQRMRREVAERLVHLDGAGRAVQPDDVGSHRLERAQRGGDLGSREHPPGELDRHLDLERHGDARHGHRVSAGDEGGLGAQQVERRLDAQQVDAALEERRRLDLVGIAQRGEGDLTERRELRPGPDAAGDEARVVRRRVAVGDFAGELGRASGELGRTLGDLVLGEHGGERAERVGLDDVDADLEERSVEISDDVRPRHDQHFVAALERRTAEVVRSEPAQLEVRAGRAVEDDDALGKQVEVSRHGPPRLPGGRDQAGAAAAAPIVCRRAHGMAVRPAPARPARRRRTRARCPGRIRSTGPARSLRARRGPGRRRCR